MYIGELGKCSGASPKAIRLYEAMGLLGAIRRRGAYRLYSEDNLRQVRLIRQAQALGFKLAEIAPLFNANGPGPDWKQLMHYLERKRTQIRQEIGRLRQLDDQLGNILAEIASCDAGEAVANNLECNIDKA